jgi:hypothetical protein
MSGWALFFLPWVFAFSVHARSRVPAEFDAPTGQDFLAMSADARRENYAHDLYSGVSSSILEIKGQPQVLEARSTPSGDSLFLYLADERHHTVKAIYKECDAGGLVDCGCLQIKISPAVSSSPGDTLTPGTIDLEVPYRGPEEDALLGLLFRWQDADGRSKREHASDQIRDAVQEWIGFLTERAASGRDGVCSGYRRLGVSK